MQEQHGGILVFSAHSDDQVLGVGGTIAKYASSGHKVTCVIFSFGEMTHPWLLRKHSASMRVKESRRAGKLLGYEKSIFLGLDEGKFKEQARERNLVAQLAAIINETKPSRIFLHSSDDLHPDHRAVYNIVFEALREFDIQAFSYEVWNPFSKVPRTAVELYVDISDTFAAKIKALDLFRSQRIAIGVLILGVYLRAILNGMHNDCMFAEKFIKIK